MTRVLIHRCAIIVALFLVGCSSRTQVKATPTTSGATPTSGVATTTAPDTSAMVSSVPTGGVPGCEGVDPMTKRNEMNEIVGTGQGVSLYGLVFLAHNPPIIFGETLKIVWRMTGSGNLTVQYFGPDKLPRTLAFGPAPHSSSTYDRPGDEWGTGFVFDQAGCWHLHFERTVGVADVFLRVGGA